MNPPKRSRGERAGRPSPSPRRKRPKLRAKPRYHDDGPEPVAPPPATLLVPDVPPDPDAPAGVVVRDAVAAALARFRLHEPRARSGDDEAVHQMRVATRRLRSDLRTFRPLLNETWARSLRDELKWLADRLGAVRDLDVMIARLQDQAAEAAPHDREALQHLANSLDDRRTIARSELLDALDHARFRALRDTLIESARAPALTVEALGPCRDVLPTLVHRVWRSLAAAGRRIDRDAPDEALHEVRIRAKRARYAAEAVAPALGKKTGAQAARFARAAADVQDALGLHQDAVVALAAIHEAAGDQPDAMSSIAQEQQKAARAARRAFRKAWNRLDRKKRRAWMD